MVNLIDLFDIAIIIQIFVLVNPLSSIPVLVSAYKNKYNVKKIALTAVILAFLIAMVLALVGPYLFDIFGVTIDGFRIAGGIVLLLLGLDTIRGGKENGESTDKSDKQVGKVDSMISILATPLLTGPATISYVTIKAFELGRLSLISNILIAFILVGIVFFILALMIPKINLKLINILSKVLGLFLTAMAIEMIAKGITNIFLAAK